MRDEGHIQTEKELAKLERRIKKTFKEASAELSGEIKDYFDQFARRDAEMLAMLDDGKISIGHYQQWRLNQIGRGERFVALRDKIAERVTKANEVAIAYTNDLTPGIYSLNRNYAAYTIERVSSSVDFALWDERTVRRLIVDRPDLMPYYPPKKALKRGIDLKYGKRQITASVTSSILQGKGVKDMADDLQDRITTMGRTSAIRTARTAVTGAQNAGRMDSYKAAEGMGIKLKKEWLATLDGRTRHSHAMLDGEQVGNDEKFSNGCMFPGDPKGKPCEVYNCRCTMIAAVDGVDTSDAERAALDPETGEREIIPDMTYQEWAEQKEKDGDTVDSQLDNDKIAIVSPAKDDTPLRDRLAEAKTTKEVSERTQEYLHEKGSKITTVDFGKSDVSAAKQMAEMLDELDSNYKSSLTSVKTRWLPASEAGYTEPSQTSAEKFLKSGDLSDIESEVHLNVTYLKSKEAIKEDFVRNRLSLHGATVDEKNAAVATLVHEFAHTICPGKLNEIYQQRGGTNTGYLTFKRQYNVYMRKLRDKQREIQAIRDSFTGMPDGLRLGIEATKDLQAEYDSMCISKYSKVSVGEFIAEAFCDAVCSSNPKPASIEVLETIKKLYGKG